MSNRVLDELGYYLLAGAGGEGPAALMDEARRGAVRNSGSEPASPRSGGTSRRRRHWWVRRAR